MRRLLMAASLCLCSGGAVAGPPYFTDDPQPTDLKHWEIYAFGTRSGSDEGIEGATGLDINYGGFRDVQLTLTLPVNYEHLHAPTQWGLGNIELAVKYRFAHQDKEGVDVAVFPRVYVPTAGKRFGSGRVALLLPVWAQKDFGPWSLFGGGGYTINPGEGNRDFW